MENFSEFIKYLWMAVVSILEVTVKFVSKIYHILEGQGLENQIHEYGMGLVTSMLVAYVIYEVSRYFTSRNMLAVALAGLASFAGRDLLVICLQIFIEHI